MTTIFVSGHLDLTKEEFAEHYAPRLKAAADAGHSFVVGDATGADYQSQRFLREECAIVPSSGRVTVYHMLERPRHSFGSGYGSNDPNLPKETWTGKRGGYPLQGGFETDEARDTAMTAASDEDIAWVRPSGSKRHGSGTRNNLQRRVDVRHEGERLSRRHYPRFLIEEDWIDHEVLRVSDEPVAPLGTKDSRVYERAVPLPPELVERLRAARVACSKANIELSKCEQEVRLWRSRQESDPV